MPKTTAERQSDYRARHATTSWRIDTRVSVETYGALERLARHEGTTRRALLERLIAEADARVADGLHGQALNDYYGVTG